MSTNSSIEWTEATWNPVAGCSLVSPGCKNCYAMRMASRLDAMGQEKYAGTTKKVGKLAVWTGKVNLIHKDLDIPFKRKKPTMYFVNSMSDLFHKDVPFDFIDKVFAVMALTPQHVYQILTKRPERMAEYLNEKWQPRTDFAAITKRFGVESPPAQEETRQDRVVGACEPLLNELGLADTSKDSCWTADGSCKAMMWTWPLPNVWLGTSCENQETADERIPHLLKCPAAVRFLSCEPLLGPIHLEEMVVEHEEYGPTVICPLSGEWAPSYPPPYLGTIDWVIVGGESGPSSRECNVEWIRNIVSQCRAADVACFVKQLGAKPIAEFGHDYTKKITGEHGVSAYIIEHKAWPQGPDEPLGSPPQIRSDGRVLLGDRKGGDWNEWPQDLKVRQFPQLQTLTKES